MISSIFSSSSGPIPRQVMVPGSTTVLPASWINALLSPASSARFLYFRSSALLATLRTIFFIPWLLQSPTSFLLDFKTAETDAWAACAAIFPLGSFKSARTNITCLYSIVGLFEVLFIKLCKGDGVVFVFDDVVSYHLF